MYREVGYRRKFGYLKNFISASHAVRIENLSHPRYVIITLVHGLLRHGRAAAKEIDTRPLSSTFFPGTYPRIHRTIAPNRCVGIDTVNLVFV